MFTRFRYSACATACGAGGLDNDTGAISCCPRVFLRAGSCSVPRPRKVCQKKKTKTKQMKASRGRWRLWMAIAVLKAMGCDGLWSPFLMEESPSWTGNLRDRHDDWGDGSLAQDMTESRSKADMKLIPKGVFIGGPTTEAGRLASKSSTW